jgi:hypothetical protein
MVGNRFAIIDLPEPGGPITKILGPISLYAVRNLS